MGLLLCPCQQNQICSSHQSRRLLGPGRPSWKKHTGGHGGSKCLSPCPCWGSECQKHHTGSKQGSRGYLSPQLSRTLTGQGHGRLGQIPSSSSTLTTGSASGWEVGGVCMWRRLHRLYACRSPLDARRCSNTCSLVFNQVDPGGYKSQCILASIQK